MTPTLPMLNDVTVIPVLAFETVENGLRVMERMVDAGLTTLELTLRTPAAMDVLSAAKSRFGDAATIGMGTILTADQHAAVCQAGADFGVSPGITPDLAAAVRASALPFLPGIATVSEAMRLAEMGFDVVKFFPAEQSGGAGFVKSMAAVLPELRVCPTGGVSMQNAAQYLALETVACVGTSSLTEPAAADPFNAARFADLVTGFSRS